MPEPADASSPRGPAAPRAGCRDPGEASPGAIDVARTLELSITVADVLHRRGHDGGEATRRFLDPRLADLTPPDAMADREVAADRLARAVRARERICVFGDYDADGITATAILTGALRALGAEVVPRLATRLEGGYGLSEPALGRVLETGATLLVTCDCGSSDHERLLAARAAGLDALVIDHHLVPEGSLPALGFLNPHRPDCGYPFKGLASCGLAFSVAAAVRKKLGASLDLRPWLDLVAIGTIGDVAPLSGDNRALVRAGLAVLSSGARPGLRALAGLAKLDFAGPVSGEDVAFRIVPRLNAPGRLGHPDLALELLLATDGATAAAMAATVEQRTAERRAIQERMIGEALSDIAAGGFAAAPGLVLARQGWHPGVVGIVAGRIASRLGKPTIVLALEGASGRGSVRGPSGFRLHDALARCREALAGFGGHQAAAGVEVRAERVEALRELWCQACAGAAGAAGGDDAELADARLDDRDEPSAVVRDLERLEPCGEGNRAPRLFVGGALVRSARDIKGHLKLEVSAGRRSLSAFGFELGPMAASLVGSRADLVGSLRRDAWRGGQAVEMRLERVTKLAAAAVGADGPEA